MMGSLGIAASMFCEHLADASAAALKRLVKISHPMSGLFPIDRKWS
jgi:hypothetical protein